MIARMAAIKATRAAGQRHKQGVNIDNLCLPHPSKNGELLSDVPLTLAPTRKYGLIGKNGAGKSTLMNFLANYMDPRITVAWCKRCDLPIEKLFPKTLKEKFNWAMQVDGDWRFEAAELKSK